MDTVLLKFPNLVAAANYAISCYSRGNVVQFEVQYIAIHSEQFPTSHLFV